jgi:hypothetical protein
VNAVRARRIVSSHKRGSSWPVVAELEEAIAQVPDDFLIPLLDRAPDAERLRPRRAAYQAFLWKRLKAPRPFVP